MELIKYPLAFFIFLSIAFSCKSPYNTNQSEMVLTMKKTACMGNCPVYEISIYENRVVLLKGVENIPYTGAYYSKLSKKEFENIEEEFNRSNFFDFDTEYSGSMTDLPTTFLTYTKGSQSKTIKDYYGAPDEIKALEKRLGSLIETLRWKPYNR